MKSSFFIFYTLLSIVFFNQSCEESQTKKPNVLLICIDDLRPELKCFGADYIYSPNIDSLASNGVSFLNHYVNAPSCGPSRYTLLTGRYGYPTNDALFKRAKEMSDSSKQFTPSMPEWFKKNGYTTVSVGKVSHHPGGRGGQDWNDSTDLEMPNSWDRHLMPVSEWQHPRGAMHGLANGEIRQNQSEMDVLQSVKGPDSIYPDGHITAETLKQLKLLSSDQGKPFFLAFGILKPHLPFGSPQQYLEKYKNAKLPPINHPNKPSGKSTWHPSNEFMKYNRWGKDPNSDPEFADLLRRHYAACVSYADAQVGKVISELKRLGEYDNTIIIIWGDHGWHLGEHGIWGKHSLFEESLKSPLIIYYPNSKDKGHKVNTIVETLDLFPTLCEITGIEIPNFTQGKSLNGIINNIKSEEQVAIAYTSKAKTIRTSQYRLVLHDDNFVELYDHNSIEKETKNIAFEKPIIVDELIYKMNKKLKLRKDKNGY